MPASKIAWKPSHVRWARALASGVGFLLFACAQDAVNVKQSALEAVCADSPDGVPDSAWRCPEPQRVECTGGDGATAVDLIYLVNAGADAGTCAALDLSVSDPGPYRVGAHRIDILGSTPDAGVELLCTAELTVADTFPPVVEGRTIVLWPPNHELHAITPWDCVDARDACDGEVDLRFTRISSDEPEDARGDGHHEPDILVADACDAVQLRAERQGGGDGRVYTLDIRARDQAGHSASGACTVIVPHDHSSDTAGNDGPAVTVDACPP